MKPQYKRSQAFAKSFCFCLLLITVVVPLNYAQTIRQAAGTSALEIQSAVANFKTDLGGVDNSGLEGNSPTGWRVINWDDVPDEFAAPKLLTADFFNTISKRGLVLATPGTGFQVSARSNNSTAVATAFGNLNPAFGSLFQPFSPERLFTPIDSNISVVSFYVPGTAVPALVSGFGVVFSDVQLAGSTKLEFFNAQGTLLFSGFAPTVPNAHQSFSFLSASFTTPQIALVRITSGSAALDAQAQETEANDLVAIDDLIYGEPQTTDVSASCGSVICFAEPSYWANQLRRPFTSVRGTVRIPGVNKTLPVGLTHPSVQLALNPSPFLAAQPRTQLIASYVAAQISTQSNLTGGLNGGASKLACYAVSLPVTLSDGVVINAFTNINDLLLATDNVFRNNQSEDISKLLGIYQQLQALCNLR